MSYRLPALGRATRWVACIICALLLLALIVKGGVLSALLAVPLLGVFGLCLAAPRNQPKAAVQLEKPVSNTFRQAIFDRSSIGIFLTDANRQIVELGEQAALMFGYTRQELIGKSFRVLHVSNEKYEEAATYFKTLMARGYHSMEYTYRHKNGTAIWCSVSGTPLDPEDRSKGTVWTLIDISERKRMEQEVRDSEERYSAIVNRSPGIVLIHVGGTIVFINEAGLRHSGYEEKEVLGSNMFRFIAPGSQAQVMKVLQERAHGHDHQDYEIEFVKKTGEVCNLVVKSTPIKFGGSPAVLVVLVDITERKRAEKGLAYRESLEKQLTRFSSEIVNANLAEVPSVLSAGLEHIARHCNIERAVILRCDGQAGSMRLGHFWDQAGAKPEERFFAGIQKCTTWLGHLRAHSEIIIDDVQQLEQDWSAERELLSLRGTSSAVVIPIVHSHVLMGCLLFETRSRKRSWLDDEIHFMRVFAALLASSINRERADHALQESNRSLEAALVKANELAEQAQQASRSKSLFLANMSHELRTPLNVILGMSEILTEGIQGPLNEAQHSNLKSIEESGRHLLSLINDILDLAKIEAGRLQLDLRDQSLLAVCEASIRMVEDLAKRKGIQISLTLPLWPKVFHADEIRMKQILINLLSNAVKFTAERGTVGLEVSSDKVPGMLAFCVSDSGVGIPPQHLAALFQPFMQVDNGLVKKHGGTGLGLALVRHFAAMHGGTVEVESEPGKGSRFTVLIPCAAGSKPPGLVSVPSLRRSSVSFPPGLRVLVAEDHPGNASVLSSMLQSRGLQMHLVTNGLAALQECPVLMPDIVLMDVQMPEMDGLEATRRLKADTRTAAIPIICLTAYAMSGDRERCLEAGANGYLSKPINFHELFEAMARLLGKD